MRSVILAMIMAMPAALSHAQDREGVINQRLAQCEISVRREFPTAWGDPRAANDIIPSEMRLCMMAAGFDVNRHVCPDWQTGAFAPFNSRCYISISN